MRDVEQPEAIAWGPKIVAPALGRDSQYNCQIRNRLRRHEIRTGPKPVTVNHGPTVPEIWAPLQTRASDSFGSFAVPEVSGHGAEEFLY